MKYISDYKIGDKFILEGNTLPIFTLVSMPPDSKWFLLKWYRLNGAPSISLQSLESMNNFIKLCKIVLPLP